MRVVFFILFCTVLSFSNDGKIVFEKYCWGCHHQQSLAFGPSFGEIASKRTKSEIIAYINNPKSLYQAFGYKRSVMPNFDLRADEYEQISEYVLSFKE